MLPLRKLKTPPSTPLLSRICSSFLLGIALGSLLCPLNLLAQLPNSGAAPGGGTGGGGGSGTGPLFLLEHFVPISIRPGTDGNSVKIKYNILVQYDHPWQPYVQVLGLKQA